VLNNDESTFQTLSGRNTLASNLLSSGGSHFFLPSRVLRGQLMIQGSFWGNYNELREVIELAKKGLIRHHIEKFRLSEANDAINRLREGKILGRAVLIPEAVQGAA
jgi:D-arabinose 1-dehydrogenase-like Zn-dependent alcohol dehydrogenase